eukprot:gene6531-7031_t
MEEERGNSPKSITVDEVTASLFQIFSQYHCLSTTKLEEFLPLLQQDWLKETSSSSSLPPLELKTIFKTMNRRLRPLSFEVKTVAFRSTGSGGKTTANATAGNSSSRNTSSSSSSDEWEYYHGLVNIEEDIVSKEFGSVFTPLELKFFHLLSIRLAMTQHLSTSDIVQLKSLDQNTFMKLSSHDIHSLLQRLEVELWVQRNDRGFYVLGPRSFLELQSYLKTTLTEGQVVGLEGYTEVDRLKAVELLPSLLFY